MSRIQLNDSMMDAIIKMVEGNPGALTACMELIKRTHEIDPQNMLAGIGNIMRLDDMGIYGQYIYVLWSDHCNRNVRRMIVLLRANQLGMIDSQRIINAAHDGTRSTHFTEEEFNAMDEFVCSKLDDFQRPEQNDG